jgi:hypothetical protein
MAKSAKRSPRKRAQARPTRARAADPGRAFTRVAEQALRRGEPDAISDRALRGVLTSAVKLYAAKVEKHGAELMPVDQGAVTATESVVAACALIRAAGLNLFDVAMWFHRAPGR